MIAEAFRINHEEAGVIPLHQQSLVWGVSKKVKIVQRADNQILLLLGEDAVAQGRDAGQAAKPAGRPQLPPARSPGSIDARIRHPPAVRSAFVMVTVALHRLRAVPLRRRSRSTRWSARTRRSRIA